MQLLLKSFITVFVLCMSYGGFSQEKQPEKGVIAGDTWTYNGDTIVFARKKEPSVYKVKDPETGEEHTEFHRLANAPRKLNGKKIYCSMHDTGITKPKIKANDRSLADFLLHSTTAEFEKLADGEYNLMISNVVINEKGRVVYYENSGLYLIGADADEKETKKEPIINKINALMDSSVVFEPATVAGKPVSYLISNTIGYRNNENIVVKNHKLAWVSIEEQ